MKYDFDVIIIGGGPAGITAAREAAETGVKTALVEKDKIGGSCRWDGCVPAKTLIKSAGVYSLARQLQEFGISGPLEPFNTDMVMSHVRSIIAKIDSFESPEFLSRSGMQILYGSPEFTDNTTIKLNGELISAKNFIIATGARPRIPGIEGIESSDYMTNRDLFSLSSLPDSLIILGGGSIGCELGQALSKLGVHVSIVELNNRILLREDEEAARVVEEVLAAEGIRIYAGQKETRIAKSHGMVSVTLQNRQGESATIKAEALLVAAGRVPNTEHLGLNKAGVTVTERGIEVDGTMKTSADNIYAAGDVVGPYRYVHAAEYQAKIAIASILYSEPRKADYRVMPWCTFTSPELARVGMTEREAREKYGEINVYKVDYKESDRAIIDLEDRGFVKVVCDGQGRILGAHVTGANAAEIIHEFVIAMAEGIPLGRLGTAVHIYPTLSRIIQETSEQFRIKESLKKLETAAATE